MSSFRKQNNLTMNQKNIYSAMGAILIIQGLAFFMMKAQLVSGAFAAIDAPGQLALSQLFEVVAALSILIGLVTYASRTTPNVSWAFTLGALILLAVTLKHKFMDGINVPVPAILIQVLMLIAFAYVWSLERKVVVRTT